MLKRILFVIFCLLYFLFFAFDQELDTQARDYIERVASKRENNAYYYLLGIAAEENHDPILVGKNRHALIQKKLIENHGLDHIEIDFSDLEVISLGVPDTELFCNISIKCLKQLFRFSNTIIDNGLAENDVLLKRYRKFLAFNKFETLHSPHAREPSPQVKYLSSGNRLVELFAISEARKKGVSAGISVLEKNIEGLRKQLAITDNFLIKALVVSFISSNLDIAAILHKPYISQVNPNRHNELTLLSKEERTLHRVFEREFVMFANTVENVVLKPKSKKSGLFQTLFLKAYYSVLYKKNITLNIQFQRIKEVIVKDRLEAPLFAESPLVTPEKIGKFYWLKNYIGTSMLEVAFPDYSSYTARLHDLNAKIVLYNRLAIKGKNILKKYPNFIANPYYPNEQKKHAENIEIEGVSLVCFDGPLRDKRRYRCLALQIL